MKTIALLLLLVTVSASALDRLNALSMLESGGDDHKIGKRGEISRYQVLPQLWYSFTDSREFSQPGVARLVAGAIMDQRIEKFTAKFGRPPTDFEYYALWNAPTEVMGGHLSPVVSERCQRFCNLVEKR